jgi:ribosomal protein L11 methyltransferase
MSESWAELNWIVERRDFDVLSAKLFDLGAEGIQEDYLPGEAPPPRQPWDTGLPPPPPDNLLLRGWWSLPNLPQARQVVHRLHMENPDGPQPKWSFTSEEDWGGDWRRHFHRHVISPELAVAPPWEAKPGDLVIEPGIAFGTGEHPTTYSCLEAIAAWAKPGSRCLDVGCGSGILALAASHLGMEARGVDIEDAAIRSANDNARKNGLAAHFDTTDVKRLTGTYDIVVANLYAEVLVALSPAIIRLCGHRIALAGILFDRHQMVLDAFAGLELLRSKREGDWISLWFER